MIKDPGRNSKCNKKTSTPHSKGIFQLKLTMIPILENIGRPDASDNSQLPNGSLKLSRSIKANDFMSRL